VEAGWERDWDSTNVSERSEGAAGGVEAEQGRNVTERSEGAAGGVGGCRRAGVGKKAARKKLEAIFAAAASKN
jgi:hypothetical protein